MNSRNTLLSNVPILPCVLAALLVLPRLLRAAGTAERRSRAGAQLWLRVLCTLGVLGSMAGGAQAVGVSEPMTGTSFTNAWTLRGTPCFTASGGGCGLSESPGMLRLTEDGVSNSMSMATLNTDFDLARGVDVSFTRLMQSLNETPADGMLIMLLDPSIPGFGTGGGGGGGGPYRNGLVGGVLAFDLRTYHTNDTILLGGTGASGSAPNTVISTLYNPYAPGFGERTRMQVQLYINGCTGAKPLSVRLEMYTTVILQDCYGPSSFGLSSFPQAVRFAVAGSTGGSTQRNAVSDLIITTADSVAGNYPYWDGPGKAGNSIIEGGSGIWNRGSAFAGNGNWANVGGVANTRWNGADTAIFGGTAATVTVDNALGAVNINGLRFNTSGYTLSGGTLTGASGTNTLTAGSGISATVGSVLAGGNGFNKAGAGTITLTGPNSYSGATTVSDGTLQVGAGGTSGTIASTNGVSVDVGATLVFNRSNADSLGSGISGVGTVTKSGAGTTTLTGNNTHTGTVNVNAGTLLIRNSDQRSGHFNIASGAVLEFDPTGEYVAQNTTFAGTGTLKKSGGGNVKWGNNVSATFALGSGSLIDVQAGTFNAQWGQAWEVWTDNKSNLNIASGAIFHGDWRDVYVNAVNGSGTIRSSGPVHIGVDNGSGTFSGIFINHDTGAGSLVKSGTGTQKLSGVSTYLGATTIDGGTLQIGDAGTTGSIESTSGISIASGANLAFNRSDAAYTASKLISGAGSVIQAGTGTTTLTGANSYTGATTVSAGTLMVGAGSTSGTIASTSGVSVAAGATLAFNRSDADSLGGAISGAGVVTKSGIGTTTLTGNNTHTGTVNVNAGTLLIRNSDQRSSQFNIASGAVLEFDPSGEYNARNTTFAGTGTLKKSGTGDVKWGGSIAATFALGSGSLIDVQAGTFIAQWGVTNEVWTNNKSNLTIASGAMFHGDLSDVYVNAVNGSGTIRSSGAVHIGVDNGSGTFDGLFINHDTGAGSLVKSGTGTQKLSGFHTYTGATTITGGTLLVNGSLATGSTVTVQTGATLGGSGAMGPVIVNSGGHLAPGNSPGTTTMSSLTVASNANLDMELGEANVVGGSKNDLIVVNGNVALNGGTLNIAVPTSPAGTFTPGTYRLINYTGTLSGSGLVLGTFPAGFSAAQLVIDTSTPNQVNLIVLPLAATYWDVAPQNNGVVDGGAGTWTPSGNGSNTNWTDSTGNSNTQWLAGGTANFGGTPGAVSVSGAPDIGGLSFTTGTAASSMYNLTGGTLNGTATTNTLTAGPGADIHATVGSVLAGSKAFAKAGAGTITLTGANTYTGATTVSAGTLVAASSTALGATAAGTTVASGATLALTGGITVGAETLSLSGTGVGSVGALSNTAGANTFGGAVTLGAASTVGSAAGTLNLGSTVGNGGFALKLDGAGNITAGGAISGAGALSKTGAGTALLNAANSYGGSTTVSGGILQLGINSALPSASATTVDAGAMLDLNGKTQSLISLTSNGTLALGATGNLTLTTGASSIGAITGSGTITLSPGVTLTLTAALNNAGVNIVLAGGTLNLGVFTHSIGNLSVTAASTLDFASAGASQLTVATLNPAFALNVSNWTQGTDHLFATAVSGTPARNTVNLSPLNNITLSGYTAQNTFWLSGTDEINVPLAPTISMLFNPVSVRTGASSTLIITLSNPNASALSGAAFTHTYPANLINASPAGGASTCTGGSVTAAAGGNSVALSGGAIAANSSCAVTVNVTSNTVATYITTLAAGALTSSSGSNTGAASASLTVSVAGGGGAASGRVFLDNGAGSGGVANDGILNGTEPPQAGVALSLSNCSGTLYGSTLTDGAGNYFLSVPSSVATGTPLCVAQTNLAGRLSTGASLGSTALISGAATLGYTYSRTTDTVAFTFSSSGHANLNFADVDSSTFAASGTNSSPAGSSLSYPHIFTAQTAGSITFSIATAVSSPTLAGWSEKIVLDPGCTGVLQSGAAELYPAVVSTPVSAGQQVCIIVQEFIPATAQNDYSNEAKVQVSLNFSNASPVLTAVYTLNDVTRVSSSALELKKEVRNVTQGALFGVSNQAKSGETLEYRITYTNHGASPITNLAISDATPAYTTFISALEGTTPASLTGCQKHTPANVLPGAAVTCAAAQATGGAGTLNFQYTGPLDPNGTGSMLFRVKVD